MRGEAILGQDGVHFCVVVARPSEHLHHLSRGIIGTVGPLRDAHDGFVACAPTVQVGCWDEDVVSERTIFGHEEGVMLRHLQAPDIVVWCPLHDLRHLSLGFSTAALEELHTNVIAIECVVGVALFHSDGLAAIVGHKGMVAIAASTEGARGRRAGAVQAIAPRLGLVQHAISCQLGEDVGRL